MNTRANPRTPSYRADMGDSAIVAICPDGPDSEGIAITIGREDPAPTFRLYDNIASTEPQLRPHPLGQLADGVIRFRRMPRGKLENVLHFRENIEPDVHTGLPGAIGEPAAVVQSESRRRRPGYTSAASP